MKTEKIWNIQQWQDIAFLTVLFFIFYMLFAGSHPLLVNDEGRYNEVAREMFAAHHLIIPTDDDTLFLDKPPLFYWLQISSFYLFGVNEWAIRLWPIICGWFACLMTYVTGFYCYDRKTAYLSFSILATAPLYFIFSHYANLDLEVAVFIAASLMSFMLSVRDGIDKPHARPMLFAYIFSGLAFMTKGLMGLVFPMMIIGIWVICFRQWRLLRHMHLGCGLLIVLAICLPWLITVQMRAPEFFKYFFYIQQLERYTGSEFNNQRYALFYVPVIIAGFFPWTIWLIQSIRLSIIKIRQEHDYLAAFLLLWIGLITLFFSVPASKINSYLLPIFPALALVTGQYIAEETLASRYWKYLLCGLGMLIVVAAIIFAFLPNKLFIHYDLSHSAQLVGALLLASFGLFDVMLFYIIKPSQRWIGLIVSIAIALMLMNVTQMSIHFKPTTKPLAIWINQHIKPGDGIVAYNDYYYDLPFYTKQRITVVTDWNNPTAISNDSWSGQMAKLLSYQPQARQWLITDEQFWQQWHSQKRLFVIVPKNKLAAFQDSAQTSTVHIIAYYDGAYLVCNQEI